MDLITSKALSKLRREKAEFLDRIASSASPSRDQIILQDYKTLLRENAEWISKKAEGSPGDPQPENVKGTPQTRKIGEIIREIKEDPNQKVFLINLFLKRFATISAADRDVILENFRVLPLEKLKSEFENLEQLFGK